MKPFKNNWRQKSIENLEKDHWGPAPEHATALVEKVHRLRTLRIDQLQPGDIRLLIGQGVGLKFLIPVAFDILRNDLFVDTEFYNGDLLQNVLRVGNAFWDKNTDLKAQLDDLLKDYTEEDKAKIRHDKFRS